MVPNLSGSDFAQADDGRFVLGSDKWLCTFHELSGASSGEHDKGETVFFTFEAVFDGNAGHGGSCGRVRKGR